jgi:hypothetical protein
VTQPPDFRELVGDDMDEQERARLERVHQMLVFAGPPPELPPALLEPDAEPTGHHHEGLPRRRVGALLALAAAIALVALIGGYAFGNRNSGHFNARGSVEMHGTKAAPHASATLAVGDLDSGGNWPLELVVHNLPRLPRNAYYEMFLTRNGKPTASCGTFGSDGKTVTVRLNAPYSFRRYTGWVVTRHVRGSRAQPIVLATARV